MSSQEDESCCADIRSSKICMLLSLAFFSDARRLSISVEQADDILSVGFAQQY